MLHTTAGEASVLGLPSLAESLRELNAHLRRLESLDRTRAALDTIEAWLLGDLGEDEATRAQRQRSLEAWLAPSVDASDQTDEPAAILVVDDSPVVRMLITAQLEDAGFSVRTASDGEQALVELGARRPAVLVTDVQMPGMSGVELLRRARELDPSLPVVLLSGEPIPASASAGAAARLGKDDPQLVTTLRGLVGGGPDR